MTLTHLNSRGEASMVDVADKAETRREARARGCIRMQPETLALLSQGGLPKGDVLATARIAGIQAAKRTPELIPLCHALPLSKVSVTFEIDEAASCVHVESLCRLNGRTGVEMEALTAVSVACLTLYDMCKAVDRGMIIDGVRLETKSGGRSGEWSRDDDADRVVSYPASSRSEVFGPVVPELEASELDAYEPRAGVGSQPGVTVRFLAELRERLGVSEMSLAFEGLQPGDIAGVKRALIAQDERFSALLEPRVLTARNQVMVNDSTAVSLGDEIAFFPPVTGG